MSGAIIWRELLLAARSGGSWLLGLMFFVIFLTFSAIALGGDLKVMTPVAPALIWLAAIFSAMLSFSAVLRSDFEDGSLEQYQLSGLGMVSLSASKACAFFIIAILPIILASPLAGIAFNLPPQTIAAIAISLLIAGPAVAAYGTFASAIMAGRGSSGFLIILLTAPLFVPVIIFGIAAVDSYANFGLSAVEFRALAGLSLIACAIGLPAAAAALNVNLE